MQPDLPANILAGLIFWPQENRLMSPDGVCIISMGLAAHKATNTATIKNAEKS